MRRFHAAAGTRRSAGLRRCHHGFPQLNCSPKPFNDHAGRNHNPARAAIAFPLCLSGRGGQSGFLGAGHKVFPARGSFARSLNINRKSICTIPYWRTQENLSSDLFMNEDELKKHLDRFHSNSRKHPYLLEVECPSNYSGLWLKDSMLAWMLCETAFKSGVAKLIRLVHFPDVSTEKVLFDSNTPALVEQMEQSLRRKSVKDLIK